MRQGTRIRRNETTLLHLMADLASSYQHSMIPEARQAYNDAMLKLIRERTEEPDTKLYTDVWLKTKAQYDTGGLPNGR